jgi:hypothetical protein
MQPWILDDGTKVYLGGNVEGDSARADTARSIIRRVQAGERETSGFGAVPHEAKLDLDQPHLVDSWLRMEFGDVVSAPEFETPASEPRPDPPDGCVY